MSIKGKNKYNFRNKYKISEEKSLKEETEGPWACNEKIPWSRRYLSIWLDKTTEIITERVPLLIQLLIMTWWDHIFDIYIYMVAKYSTIYLSPHTQYTLIYVFIYLFTYVCMLWDSWFNLIIKKKKRFLIQSASQIWDLPISSSLPTNTSQLCYIILTLYISFFFF